MPPNVISELKEDYANLILAVFSSSSSGVMVWLANNLGKRVVEKVWEVRLSLPYGWFQVCIVCS